MSARRRQRPRARRAQAGFTLIELMISLVMFSFAIAGVLSVAVTMVNGFREQRLAIATESAARAGMEFMSDAIRGASPGVPSGVIDFGSFSGCDGTPVTGNSDAFRVINSSTAPDAVTVVFAYGSVVTSSRTDLAAGSTTLEVVDASQLAPDDYVVVSDFDRGILLKITNVAGNVLTVDRSCGAPPNWPASGYPKGALVVRAARATFSIAQIDGIPMLMMDPDAENTDFGPEPLAEGVEDLQVALAVENGLDPTTVTELGLGGGDDEWAYNVAGEPDLLGTIRGIRISLIARATNPVTGVGTYVRPAAEDRAAASVADGFRRRVLTSIIEIRNLGGSP